MANIKKESGGRAMSLLAESLVEEWLNRAGFFTVRGARFGVSEMDLLAVRQGASGLEGRHVEVHVSTNPISYICPLTDEQAKRLGKAKTSAWARPREILEESVAAWIEKKFLSPAKIKARNRAWPDLSWSLEFVHGAVRHPEELDLIRAKGIQTTPFHSVLASLCNDAAQAQKGGAGSDIAEMIAYYVKARGPAAVSVQPTAPSVAIWLASGCDRRRCRDGEGGTERFAASESWRVAGADRAVA